MTQTPQTSNQTQIQEQTPQIEVVKYRVRNLWGAFARGEFEKSPIEAKREIVEFSENRATIVYKLKQDVKTVVIVEVWYNDLREGSRHSYSVCWNTPLETGCLASDGEEVIIEKVVEWKGLEKIGEYWYLVSPPYR